MLRASSPVRFSAALQSPSPELAVFSALRSGFCRIGFASGLICVSAFALAERVRLLSCATVFDNGGRGFNPGL